jgi:hypothetical protein
MITGLTGLAVLLTGLAVLLIWRRLGCGASLWERASGALRLEFGPDGLARANPAQSPPVGQRIHQNEPVT